ncbi:MAG TPA: hypothetical protein VFG45_10640 [Candidatus Nitrosocosmicus sp.]|jgi:hypothetical protein|nr:hypothetical protein [Candidatus Nitrosocosmicus sp.]
MNSRIKKIATLIDQDLHSHEVKIKSIQTLVANKDQIIQVNKYLRSLRRRITLPNSFN